MGMTLKLQKRILCNSKFFVFEQGTVKCLIVYRNLAFSLCFETKSYYRRERARVCTVFPDFRLANKYIYSRNTCPKQTFCLSKSRSSSQTDKNGKEKILLG